MTSRQPAALRQRILSLSSAQQQLLRQQLEAQGIDWHEIVGSQPASQLAPRPERLPLSPSQKHLWVIHQLYPETSAYNIAITLQLVGDLDVSALTQSLQAIVQRHESLRTVFIRQDGQPHQKILPHLSLEIPVIDLRQLADPAEKVQQWQEQLAHQPFDLATPPLVRAHLLQIKDDQFEFVLVLHHLVADGWSRGVLLQELATYYRGYCIGQLVSLSPLSIQYADYVMRQQKQSLQPDYQEHLAYWKQQLKNLTPLNLPRDHGSVQNTTDFSSRTLTCTFSAEQTQAIKHLSQQSGATLFMVLLTVFKLLLHRYSGQRDIAVGVPVAGRNTADVEPLIGFFVNTLVLRTYLNDLPTFRDWLHQVQATVADALQHQDVPFAEVVEALEVERTPGQNPLFQVMFQVQSGYQLQNAEQLAVDMPGLSPVQGWIELNQTKFDMSWHVIERDGSLLVAVEYRTGVFGCDLIKRMLSHFQTLTTSVLANPDSSIADLPLLSPQEYHQLLEWGQGRAIAPIKECFPQRFEQQAKNTPDALAIEVKLPNRESTFLTYQALNQKANQLAHWLTEHDVSSETLVGVCLSPSIDLVVALLGILKAGGAYVPLDPLLPKTRLRYMVQDACPQVLITHSEHLSLLAQENSALSVCLDREQQLLAQQPITNLAIEITPDHLAYVIYTSGSTGKPKGTLLTHGGLINYLNWCISSYPLTDGSGVPVQSSVGFDATITSLFSPLLVGQSLLFNPHISEIEAIHTALSTQASLIKLTPAHLRALQPLLTAQPLAPEQLPKALIIGGEALHEHHISLWRTQYPNVALINEYGPTEAVVGCCVHWVSPDDRDNLPIGCAIDGVQLYVLDQYLKPVPVGIPGELYVGGPGVARGYLNQPELTAEKFIDNPFTESGSRTQSSQASKLYKTGDLVCYQSAGTLTYLGRIDNQIKVRGFRIEPGEVEALLCQHPQVDQAVVMLHKAHGREDLVAYVVVMASADREMVASAQSLAADLRHYSAQALPAYMVPTQFVELEHLPLTSNGKVDRAALPSPEVAESIQTQLLPRTDKEEILLDIWQQILGSHAIGTQDNFFELGGDSISAMQIVSKAQQQGLSLTPTQLFEHQTIATQAAVATQNTISLSPAPAVGEAPLAPIQWDFFSQELPTPHHYNQSIMVVVQPEVAVEHLQTALQLLIEHHDAFRLRFKKELDQSPWQQYYGPAVEVPFDVIEITDKHHLNETIAKLQGSLNITTGPVFRATLLHLQTGGSRLFLAAHHLIVDGVSWRILLIDLLTAYSQLEAQQIPTLPQKTTAFGHWSRHLQGRSFKSERVYWSKVCEPVSPLPMDKLNGCNTVAQQREISVGLDTHQTTLLKSLKHPVDVLLVTALAQTLSQWSRNKTLVFDMEDHGRHSWSEDIDLSRTVGWFTALFPVRLSLPLGSLDEQISHVQDTIAQVPNHGVGYGALRTGQAPDPTLNSPAQISFNYLGRLTIDETQDLIQGLAPESVTAMRHPETPCRYPMEMVAFVQPNKAKREELKLSWRYGQQCYHSSTLEQLSQRYLANLRSLIAHCHSSGNSRQPAASLTAARVDSKQLSQLMNKLAAKGRT
ncbi:MAG: amino acid adenylation domain-containing protein [Cyanobacteria bacterium P01_B01_bin.77]